MMLMVISGLTGGAIAIALAIIGYLMAGLLGELAGALLGIAAAVIVGVWIGSRS